MTCKPSIPAAASCQRHPCPACLEEAKKLYYAWKAEYEELQYAGSIVCAILLFLTLVFLAAPPKWPAIPSGILSLVSFAVVWKVSECMKSEAKELLRQAQTGTAGSGSAPSPPQS